MDDKELFGNTEQLDTISRAAAIDAALTYLVEYCGAAFDEDMQRMLKERLDSLPSAQQERKKGKWIYNSPVTMKCNQCGFVIKDWDWHRFKYCPNCIADMRGENDD